ncbi:MAG TPA: preprotein translocase subunit SecE [Candidatus Magasanikbacteria bacterium]|nr:preprotein translocase subunit SecE [Candidatus Magasanikbacteria bacterium]
MNKIFAYFREAIAEMKKVVWPTKKQTINYTLVVIALSISVAVFFGILDYVFNLGLAQFLQIK